MTASKPPNPPSKHHFVPRFLLERWAVDGMVARYGKLPIGKVTMDWRSPAAIGYDIHLYTFPELGEAATSIETVLMGKLDDNAAKIVQKIVDEGLSELTGPELVWWSHFLLSMIIRNPESVNALKEAATAVWAKPDPKTQEEYEKLKGPSDPETIEQWLIEDAGGNEKGAQQLGQKILHSLVMNQNIADYIRTMHWFVITTNEDQDPFLISDRPLFSSNGLKKENGQLLLPLGPHALFAAFHDAQYAEEVKALPAEEIVEMMRKLVTVRAQKFVYASTDGEKDFVGKWLGYEKTLSMGETLAKGWLTDGLPTGDDDEDGPVE